MQGNQQSLLSFAEIYFYDISRVKFEETDLESTR
jgi:hypothetical protein